MKLNISVGTFAWLLIVVLESLILFYYGWNPTLVSLLKVSNLLLHFCWVTYILLSFTVFSWLFVISLVKCLRIFWTHYVIDSLERKRMINLQLLCYILDPHLSSNECFIIFCILILLSNWFLMPSSCYYSIS